MAEKSTPKKSVAKAPAKAPARKVEETPQQRSALTEKLLANARKSGAELSELTGLPPEECIARLSALLEDRGWMTERMEERLLIIQLDDIITDARQTLKRASFDLDNYASIANVVLKGLAQIAQRFDQRRKIVDADLERVTAAYARKMVDIVEKGATSTIDWICETYPEVDRDLVEAKLQQDILATAREVDREQ